MLIAVLLVTFLHWKVFVHNLNITDKWILNIFKIHPCSKNLLIFCVNVYNVEMSDDGKWRN
jgi:hypothetical protein